MKFELFCLQTHYNLEYFKMERGGNCTAPLQ